MVNLNGNQTIGTGGRTYTYNAKNQTSAIGSTALSYIGDSQDELTGIGSTSLENNPLGVGISTTSGTSTYYVREPDGSPISTKTGSTRAYYITDQLGSVTGLTNGSSLANSYRYQPYGGLASSSTTVTNQLKFAAGVDTGLGVYHFGARYYDPAASRWTQIDPIDRAGDLREANRYAYAGDNPISLSDESGLGLDDWVEKRFHAGEKFIFSESLKFRSKIGKWGVRAIRGSSALGTANWVWECSKKLSGGDLAGNEDQGDCDPLQPDPAY